MTAERTVHMSIFLPFQTLFGLAVGLKKLTPFAAVKVPDPGHSHHWIPE